MIWMIGISVPTWAGPGPYPPDPEMHELRTRAWSLALLHQLDLDAEQRDQAREILSPFRAELDVARKKMEAWRDNWMKPRLENVITSLEAGRLPEPPQAEAREAFRELRRNRTDLEIQAEAVVRRLENILTDSQLTALREFHPRAYIGFGPDRSGLRFFFSGEPLDTIRAIRTVPEEDFEALLDKLHQRMEAGGPEKRGRHGRMMSPERREMRQERVQQMIEMMREIRDMPEEEYASRLETLEEEFASLLPSGKHGGKPGMMRGGKGGHGMGEKGPMHGRGKHRGKGGRILNQILFSNAFFEAL